MEGTPHRQDAAASSGTATSDPDADLDERRRQRRDPRVRRVSSRTAFLLLLTIVQAAFGYAFLGPAATNQGLRDAHLLVGLGLVALGFLAARAIDASPEHGFRIRLMRAATWSYAVLAVVQLLTGGAIRWTDLGAEVPLLPLHLAAGLTLPFLALVGHMGAVQPSLRLGADREHRRAMRAIAAESDADATTVETPAADEPAADEPAAETFAPTPKTDDPSDER